MWKRRLLELVGSITAGDGLTTILAPRGHMRLWQSALPWTWWRQSVEWFVDRPGFTRAVGTAQVALGAWISFRASRDLR